VIQDTAPASNVVSIGPALRRVVLRLIDAETDPTERKIRVMIAYQTGHLTAQEAEDWIVLQGLESA
jgi:hypothetical protein